MVRGSACQAAIASSVTQTVRLPRRRSDAVRALHPGERVYTFWDYFRNAWARNAGLRIDHLLLSPSIVDRLISADVDRQVRSWEKASDHAPTWIELGMPARAALTGGEDQ